MFGDSVKSNLKENLVNAGADGTVCMSVAKTECVKALEEQFNTLLQWIICLVHCDELPLRNVLTKLDGTTKSPHSFSGKIEKFLDNVVSEGPVEKFEVILHSDFSELPNEIIADLSNHQYYAYKIL